MLLRRAGLNLSSVITFVLTFKISNAERSFPEENTIKESQQNHLYYQYPFPYTFVTPKPTVASQQQQESTEISARDYMAGAPAPGIGYEPVSAYHYQIYQSKNIDGGQGEVGYSQQGYAQPQPGYGQPQQTYGQPSPSYGESGGYDSGGGDSKTGLGILALVGLKGIGIIKFLKLLPVIGPIILPLLPLLLLIFAPILLIFAPILLIPLLPILLLLGLPLLLLLPLLFILPVPVLQFRSLPGLQRINLLENILYRDECVEKLSCEVSRIVNSHGFSAPWMKNFIEKSSPNSQWVNRIARAAEASDCKSYSCGIVNSMKEALNNINQPR